MSRAHFVWQQACDRLLAVALLEQKSVAVAACERDGHVPIRQHDYWSDDVWDECERCGVSLEVVS